MTRIRRPVVFLFAWVLLAMAVAPSVAPGASAGALFDACGTVEPGALSPPSEWTSTPTTGLWAQGTVPVPILATVEWQDGDHLRVDGLVHNPAGALSNYEEVIVRLIWLDASDNPVTEPWETWAHTWVLAADDTADFSFFIWGVPENATHYELDAYGTETTAPRISLDTAYVDSGYGVGGPEDGRWWMYSVTNNTGQTLEYVHVSGWEHEGLQTPDTLLDTLDVQGFVGDGAPLHPGDSVLMFLVGRNDPVPGNNVAATVVAEGFIVPPPEEDTSPPIPVHRFYDLSTGVHSYVWEESEVVGTITYLGWRYVHDGVAFNVYRLPEPGMARTGTIPVHLFFNRASATWFYTASRFEAEQLMWFQSDRYGYVGPLWVVPETDDGTTLTVFRFYCPRTDSHFYTASEAERDEIVAKLGYMYYYEGPAFFALPAQAQ